MNELNWQWITLEIKKKKSTLLPLQPKIQGKYV